MTALDDVCRRWRPQVRAAVPAGDDEFVDELTTHVAQRWLDTVALGRTPAEADRAAQSELDAWAGIRPPARRPASRPFIGSGLDWRSALRVWRWRPAFTASAAVLTAIAVGTAGALAAIVYGVLLRPLPYPDGHRLMTVWESTQDGITQVSYPNYLDLRANGVFDLAAAFGGGTATFSGGVSVERVNVLGVEPDMLTMLGAAPVKGRLLGPSDARTSIALISHRLWRTQFGGDEAIVGRTFLLSGRVVSIAGVLQPGFDFEVPVAGTFLLANHDVWQPFDSSDPLTARRDVSTFQVLARLAPGATVEQAQAAAAETAKALAARYPETNATRAFQVVPLADVTVASARKPLWLAAAGGTILVLAALANLGSLALARFAGRQREFTVRLAIGASQYHILRQVLTEHLPVVAGGTAIGVLTANVAVAAVAASSSVRLPRPDAIAFDGPAWAVAAAVSMAALFVLAVLPVVLSRRSIQALGVSRSVGPASRRSRRILVASEITVALVLCSAAALVAVTLVRLLSVDPGFDTTGRLTFRVTAYASRHAGKAETLRFFSSLEEALRQVPGVHRVAAGSSLPLSGHFSGIGVLSDAGGAASVDREPAGWQFVTPGFFAATGIPVIEGRDFTAAEQASDAHLTILSAELARRLFGPTSPVGRRVQVGGGTDWHEVIGVVGDVRHRSLRETAAPRVFDLAGQHWGRTMYVVVQSRTMDPGGLRDAVIRATQQVDSGAPVFEVATVDDLVSRSVATERLASLVAGAVALLALVLATFGVHAIVACSVAERMREMGVRAALGATRSAIARLVLAEAGGLAAAGGLAGIALAALTARMMGAYLYGLAPADAWPIIAGVAAAVAAAVVSAALPPSLRAASVDPARVLQE